MIKLTDEQRRALQKNPSGVECQDDATQKVYFLIDQEVHWQAMAALREQREWNDLQVSIAQADAGEAIPLEETDAQLRDEFGLPPRS